jgi:hypothetical protein
MDSLDWFNHNIYEGKIVRENLHWTMKRQLNNEGQVNKTGYVNMRALMGGLG